MKARKRVVEGNWPVESVQQIANSTSEIVKVVKKMLDRERIMLDRVRELEEHFNRLQEQVLKMAEWQAQHNHQHNESSPSTPKKWSN